MHKVSANGVTANVLAVLVACLFVAPGAGGDPDLPGNGGEIGVELPVLIAGAVLGPADLPLTVDEAALTDVEAFRFDDDGLLDLAVAWYADDPTTPTLRRRYLTIYRGIGAGFDEVAQIDLYRPSSFPFPLDDAVFDNGSGEIVVGDYDGDGDQDLAVLPYFSAEIWFIENLGGGAYTPHYKYIFGQFGGGFLSPPEGAAADFDGDGRDDLVYVVNPTPDASGQLHFWKTAGSIAAMVRVGWQGFEGGVATTDTLGLAVADFDGDNIPDVAFTAREQIAEVPVIVIWHDFNSAAQEFAVHLIYPTHYSADIVAVKRRACGADLVTDDRAQGRFVTLWSNDCTSTMAFTSMGRTTGLAGGANGFGLVLQAGDVNGDGKIDVVSRQRRAAADEPDQIELLLWDPIEKDFVLDSEAIDSTGYSNYAGNQILRPRNLVVADLYGDGRSEIAAGFVGVIQPGTEAQLDVAVWSNGCLADIDGSGVVDLSDLSIYVNASLGEDIPEADLNRDGLITVSDLALLLTDFGCRAIRP